MSDKGLPRGAANALLIAGKLRKACIPVSDVYDYTADRNNTVIIEPDRLRERYPQLCELAERLGVEIGLAHLDWDRARSCWIDEVTIQLEHAVVFRGEPAHVAAWLNGVLFQLVRQLTHSET